jgi:mono/diheme cytochrome c family protein
MVQVSRFDASIDKVYPVPLPIVALSTDPAVIARGKHLADSIGACTSSKCHGKDLGGGEPFDMGPVMAVAGPNITSGGIGIGYSDGELARLIRHGLKKDSQSVRFMPAQDFSWLPDPDVFALISYLRVAPAVDRLNGGTVVRTLGKVLDRRGQLVLDVARRIAENPGGVAPPATPTAAYGAFVVHLCEGCHGERLSGGPLPGAPPSVPIPLNLTPDATGLKDWTFDDFEKLLRTAVRKNGKPLDPFMPVEATRNLDDVEMHALWAYLRTVQPVAFGNR